MKNYARKGMLVIISGFSGAGKGTVTRELLEKYPDRYRLSISATTRPARKGEVDGVHYFFVTQDRFEEMIEAGEFLEYAEYVNKSYGTPVKFVNEQLEQGYDVILEIEQQGAFQVKKVMPEALLIFITPPDIAELERRLRDRGRETEEEILLRLQKAASESEYMELFDYLVINDDLSECVERLHNLIQTEGNRMAFQNEKLVSLREGLTAYRKEE